MTYFNTYKRRKVTRRSGNKASGIKTGGECIVQNSENYIMTAPTSELVFERNNISLENLFELDLGIIAFGGYIKASNNIALSLEISFEGNLEEERKISEIRNLSSQITPNTWNGIGLHITQKIDPSVPNIIKNVTVIMKIDAQIGTKLQFSCFDFNRIDYKDYLSHEFYTPFKQKTSMHIPHIYYLSTDKNINQYLISSSNLNKSQNSEPIILKSCNRCTRYLPINIMDELNTLAFSLHCKKKAPCTHSLFSSYKIMNHSSINKIQNFQLIQNYIKNGEKISSYYGHQLECRSCKKYYVNHALNPLRNPQQFKEDGLRRRSLEILVNRLLERNIIHFEYEHQTKKHFSEYIWNKFDQRCFKCKKKLNLNEMHLDHTMPLAYLYRLDETATCLCAEHNSKKRDNFPVEFYSEEELITLSNITGLDYKVLKSKTPNMNIVRLLEEHVEWFFDEFLMNSEYQKIRDERLTADKIYASLVRILKGTNVDLLKTYQKNTNKIPKSISIYEY